MTKARAWRALAAMGGLFVAIIAIVYLAGGCESQGYKDCVTERENQQIPSTQTSLEDYCHHIYGS